ncbi:hypothetical protein Bbelb_208610, partial [Branchiostoma belcheri]
MMRRDKGRRQTGPVMTDGRDGGPGGHYRTPSPGCEMDSPCCLHPPRLGVLTPSCCPGIVSVYMVPEGKTTPHYTVININQHVLKANTKPRQIYSMFQEILQPVIQQGELRDQEYAYCHNVASFMEEVSSD